MEHARILYLMIRVIDANDSSNKRGRKNNWNNKVITVVWRLKKYLVEKMKTIILLQLKFMISKNNVRL